MGQDLIGLAQTGTGKTAGFTLPMIEILQNGKAKRRMPRSLILSPTRELAAQISDNFETYGKYTKLDKALLTGGVSMAQQQKVLESGADVLIATPGRFIDLVDRGTILLNDIKILVIDEADRMLDMGFIPDIEKIISLLPFNRQTLLFSATMPKEIKKLADKFLTHAKTVSVAATSSASKNVDQSLLWVNKRNKDNRLFDLLKKEDVKNAFIFCNRKVDVDALTRKLKAGKYKAAAMHGDMPQKTRTETLVKFKAGDVELLVCSDVAARGLDVDAVSHVFNYDIPRNSEDYVHRIGRTGRAGKSGKAFSFAVQGNDEKYVESIEKMLKKAIPTLKEEKVKKLDHKKTNQKDDRSYRSKGKKGNDRHKASEEGFGDDVPAFFKASG